jgi:hypothetical protein
MLNSSRTRMSYSDQYREALFHAGVSRALRLMIPLAGDEAMSERMMAALQALIDLPPIVAVDHCLSQTVSA